MKWEGGKIVCDACGWVGKKKNLTPNRHEYERGNTVYECPRCRVRIGQLTDCFSAVCEKMACWERAEAELMEDGATRNLCGRHHTEIKNRQLHAVLNGGKKLEGINDAEYLVFPGFLQDRLSGQQQWVSGLELIKLYGVDPAKCKVVRSPEDFKGMGSKELSRYIHLHPRFDGKYEVPK